MNDPYLGREPTQTNMQPKQRQLLLMAVWILLVIMNLYDLMQRGEVLNSFGSIMRVVATICFALLAVDAFRKYRKL